MDELEKRLSETAKIADSNARSIQALSGDVAEMRRAVLEMGRVVASGFEESARQIQALTQASQENWRRQGQTNLAILDRIDDLLDGDNQG